MAKLLDKPLESSTAFNQGLLVSWVTATIKLTRTNSAYSNNDLVHQSVDVGAFESCLPAVHHQFCVAAGEDHHPVAPARVADHTAAQQDLVVVQRVRLLVPGQGSLELAKHVVRWLAHDFTWTVIRMLITVTAQGSGGFHRVGDISENGYCWLQLAGKLGLLSETTTNCDDLSTFKSRGIKIGNE